MSALGSLVQTPGGQRTTGQHRCPAALQRPATTHRQRTIVPRLPRRFGPGLLLVAGLAQASAATGWVLGYGWSPAGVLLSASAALTLLIRAGVRW